MVKINVAVLLTVLVTACGNADNAPAPDTHQPAQRVPADTWERLKKSVVTRLDTMAGKPRTVPRGAKPEIIVKGEQLFIAGTPVAIGQPFDVWRQAIPGIPRCNGVHDAVCNWDDLGLSLIKKGGMVHEFTVYFNIEPFGIQLEKLPDGRPAYKIEDKRPKHPFPGYLEWDGYGIDANTRFWEIRASVAPERNVRCDLFTNNCGSTTAHFSDHAVIYLELYLTIHENGRLAMFSIGR